MYDGGARGLAKQANAVVVSVDYRRAPEAKFPAAWDDALAAYKWAASNAATIKGDPMRLALAGESAGGNLAIATAIAARDAGITAPKAIVSVYPVAQTGREDDGDLHDCQELAIVAPIGVVHDAHDRQGVCARSSKLESSELAAARRRFPR